MSATALSPPLTPARRVLAFVRLGRPRFLVGGFVLHALGAAIAAPHRALDLRAYAWGQAAITATQLMTHYANDYFDLDADRANDTATPWSGGSRVLPGGELPPRAALVAATVLGAAALGIDAVIALRVAPDARVVSLLLAALVLSWGYSAPPLRLCARGLGAFTAALVVTVITPLIGYSLQLPGSILPALVATAPLACAQLAMILVIDFPDAAGDRAAGKATLAVRFGARASARLCIAVACAPYVALPLLAIAGLPARVVVAVVASAPAAALLVVSLARGDWSRPERWTRLTWSAVAWLAILTGLELAAYVSLAVQRSRL